MLHFLLSIVDENDQEKIKYIYHTYHTDMLRFAKHRLHTYGDVNYDDDAQDVVQSAFLKITKYIHAIDLSLSHNQVRAYVLAIVANEAKNFIAECEDVDELTESIPDEDFFAKMRLQVYYNYVVQSIEAMDEKYGVVLLLRYRDNYSVREIAKLLGVGEKAVYTRLDRGKKKLLEALEKEKKKDGANR